MLEDHESLMLMVKHFTPPQLSSLRKTTHRSCYRFLVIIIIDFYLYTLNICRFVNAEIQSFRRMNERERNA